MKIKTQVCRRHIYYLLIFIMLLTSSRCSSTPDLGNSLLYGKIKLDGVIYQLPAPFKDFGENGWVEIGKEETGESEGVQGTKVNPEDMDTVYLTKDGTEIEATVVNYSNNEAPLEECIVAKVYVEAPEERDNSVLLVPGEIGVGISEEELISKLQGTGAQSQENNGDVLYYVNGIYNPVGYKFDVKNGVLHSIEADYLMYSTSKWELEEKLREAQRQKKNGDNGKLSKDPYSFQIKYGDALFQIPCTAQELEDAGWLYYNGKEKIAPNSRSAQTFINLECGGIRCLLTNDSSTEKYYKECKINRFSSDTYIYGHHEVQIELPADIYVFKSSIDDVILAYGQPDNKNETKDGTMLEYIAELGTYERKVLLYFDTDSKILKGVTLINNRG